MKTARKFAALFLALTLLICTFTGTAVFAADSPSSFTIDTNGVLTGYTGAGGDVTIPDTVKIIGANAFDGCKTITSVTIPEGVTTIEKSAFVNCSNLASASFPSTLSSVEDAAFENCPKFADITVPELSPYFCMDSGVLFSKDKAVLVLYPAALSQTSYTVPTGVNEIASTSFTYASHLTDVTIPDGVTKIGSSAFENCQNLANISIPASVTEIGGLAFEGTPWQDNNTNPFVTINHILVRYHGADGVVTVPNDVTYVAEGAFYQCSVTSVSIPNTVTKIGYGAFLQCTQLTKVVLPAGLTKIDTILFLACNKLNTVTIPNTVTEIGAAAFMGCTALTNISIPGHVALIGANAFWGCGLTDVILPNSVTEIGSMAFSMCPNLKFVSVPSSVTKIADDAFLMNSGITIFGFAGSAAQSNASKNNLKFASLITYKGTGFRGTVTLDTQSYDMAPKNIYDIGVKFAGNGNTKTFKVVSSRDGIATVKKLPNGNYRITGVTPGTAYIICTIYNGTKEITHASIKVTVTAGIKQHGVATRSTSYFN